VLRRERMTSSTGVQSARSEIFCAELFPIKAPSIKELSIKNHEL
jgi:hypothetical protein